MRVLLVDDNEELREFLALSLTEGSVDVVAVGTSGEAIALVEAEKFDAFVIDSVMGTDDGLTLVSQLKVLKNARNVPIMLMSSISTSLARRMAQSLGCKEFLVKPFGQSQFLEQVRGLK